MTFPPKIWAGGIALAAALFVWLWIDNARLEARLAEERAANSACLMANDAFAAQLRRQSSSVATLKKESAARAEKARKTAQTTKKTVFLLQEKEAAFRKAEAQGEPCAVAEILFNAYVKDTP